ncbi:MAG TPA: UDP-N-acetylglucosamine 1-carboxyvinyltransferase, partial [Armatimonadetes bacterium]|nr:UDP-N-acetylglucosamine 1-carboxyvinyltransferase [Armatimonadota bacterium]
MVIDGGQRLAGTIRPVGNKNEALPAIAACLLTDREVILDNVPDILDVRAMLELVAGLGVEVSQRGPQT